MGPALTTEIFNDIHNVKIRVQLPAPLPARLRPLGTRPRRVGLTGRLLARREGRTDSLASCLQSLQLGEREGLALPYAQRE